LEVLQTKAQTILRTKLGSWEMYFTLSC